MAWQGHAVVVELLPRTHVRNPQTRGTARHKDLRQVDKHAAVPEQACAFMSIADSDSESEATSKSKDAVK